MKTPILTYLLGALLPLCIAATADAQTAAFTYQGRLTDNSQPANGNYDLQFTLKDAAAAGNTVGVPITVAPVSISNGLFTVTLDFGAGAFAGQPRWLEIGVRTNGSVSAHAILAPRQAVTATPYAIQALTAGTAASAATLSGMLPGSLLSGTYGNPVTFNNAANSFAGNGGGLTNVNALTVGGLAAGSFWQTGGNAGTTAGAQFLGTPDYQPLEFKVSGLRALRLEPTGGAPNVIGGTANNATAIGVTGAAIGGGSENTIQDSASHATVAGGLRNQIQPFSSFGSIGGGVDNTIHQYTGPATIAGGQGNSIHTNADYAAIGGGQNNALRTNAKWATIGGGSGNVISNAHFSTISGGMLNAIPWNSAWATISGGEQNAFESGAWHSSIGGGLRNKIQSDANTSTIAGGIDNLVQTNADSATIAGGAGNIVRNEASYSSIGGGRWNTIQNVAEHATIAGGVGNVVQINADHAAIGGGEANSIQDSAFAGTIAGGSGNLIKTNAAFATIPGGKNNLALGEYSLAAGRFAHADHRGSFVWADAVGDAFASTQENEFAARASGGFWFASHRGIRLDSWNGPLITRGWDLFDATAPSEKQSHGRWGLFLEPYTLVAGIPAEDVGGRWFEVAKFALNGSRTTLLSVNQAGEVTATTFTPSSDRDLKENFCPANLRQILDLLIQVPIQHWNFKQDPAVPHLGPVAQDFRAAFGLGADDRHIATVDADGVALAAIQGLNLKLEEQIKGKDAEIQGLKQRLADLEQLVNRLAGQTNGELP